MTIIFIIFRFIKIILAIPIVSILLTDTTKTNPLWWRMPLASVFNECQADLQILFL